MAGYCTHIKVTIEKIIHTVEDNGRGIPRRNPSGDR